MGVQGVPGTSGQICLTGPLSYSVEEAGESPRDVQFEEDPLLDRYQSNIGGQIRAVAKLNIALPGEEVNDVLIWGHGASVRYGHPGEDPKSILLRRPGAVTGLAPIRVESAPQIVYATERGLGMVGLNPERAFVDMVDAYRSVPSGVWSVAADDDGDRIAFATGDGYLQVTSVGDLSSRKECASILSSSRVLRVGEQNYLPVDVELTSRLAFVLATLGSMVTSTAPTFEQVYDPIFTGMIADVPISIVRGVNLDNGEIYEVSFDAADDSFRFYDRFIPTDITTDGQDLYVVGIAYQQQAVESFLVSNCVGSSDEQVACMREAARDSDGSLTLFNIDGIFPFNAGFFVYRNSSDLSKADHFTDIQLTAFQHDVKAPPFVYRIAVDGDRGFVRGPNFMVAMSRQVSSLGQEEWRVDSEVDKNAGLMAGIPNALASFAGGAAASFTAVRSGADTGASALELMSADGSFSVLDTGAILIRVEGGGGTMVAAVEMVNAGGGNLYLENAADRFPINDLGTNAYVSHADYDGDMLAFIWSSTGTEMVPEARQGWRLVVQRGDDAATRGDYFFRRTDKWHFKDFPQIEEGLPPNLLRGVGDLALASGYDKVAVLYTGYSNGKWYYQLGLYSYAGSQDQYKASLVGISKTKKIEGYLSAHRGRILKVEKVGGDNYKIVFSAADGVYSWTVRPGEQDSPGEGEVNSVIPVNKIVDAAMDAIRPSRLALVSGNNIVIKDLADPAVGFVAQVPTPEGFTQPLHLARVALAGDVLALATPYGATSPFFLYKVQDDSISLLAPCSTCFFLDVNIFKSFPGFLLASSMSSGIEIYSIEGL